MATTLLISALLAVAPATAQAASARDSVSYAALSSKRGSGSSGGGGVSKGGGGVSKSGGYKKSKGGGYTSKRNDGGSSSGKKNMPLWQALLFLLLLGCLIGWVIVRLVRKFRKLVSH
ncbi:hypothetical protein VT50_0203310 [Streptomyces antioxidans]|uniref:Secreted protein n=1 Tax=Streptomyces antioxidans TaxID=1507734 RepID=A0A1V4DC14_9ACTN|nr:hypothetical protein [Streptomyces antioxidans]OPF83826.1 hypothetical protein VT50_0203310 [Streptomyces antioxidans]